MAKGSHAVLGSYPNVCAGCGQPVRLNGIEPLWFETCLTDNQPRSFHVACRQSRYSKHPNEGAK